jgi:hypothetical protein
MHRKLCVNAYFSVQDRVRVPSSKPSFPIGSSHNHSIEQFISRREWLCGHFTLGSYTPSMLALEAI